MSVMGRNRSTTIPTLAQVRARKKSNLNKPNLLWDMTMAARKWTPEQRQRQAEAIRRSKIWLYSTGPTSEEGKARVAQNGYRGGDWLKFREAIKMLNQALREQRDSIL